MGSSDRKTVWKTTPYIVHRRSWGNEAVLYHSGSGDTHLIDTSASQVLDCLGQRAANAERLYEHLGPQLGAMTREQGLEQLDRILEALRGLGLIEPEAPSR